MPIKRLVIAGAALLASCAWSPGSNWHLMDEGYSIGTLNGSDFVIEVHVNQLKQLGGEVTSAEFRHFVVERLKWHGLCPTGWALADCVADGSCIQRTHRSVTVAGRCAVP